MIKEAEQTISLAQKISEQIFRFLPKQKNLSDLEYGVSVTDECMSWETTADIIRKAFQ